MVLFNRLLGFMKGAGNRSGEVMPARFTEAYENLEGFNIVAAVSNKLANIVCSEGEIKIEGSEGERVSLLNDMLASFMADLRSITARVFGTGGVLLRPYVWNGAVYIDSAAQERFIVPERHGGGIRKAGFIADIFGDYTRVELHTLSEGNCIIENKAYEGEREVPLNVVSKWGYIEPRTVIEDVRMPLFAHLRCPVDVRDGDSSGFGIGEYGVPITHGQDWLIKAITELLAEIPLEYRNKRAFIGAEDLLFDSRDRLPESGLYKLLRASGGESRSFWEVFSPEIRHTSYFEGLNYLFGLLEKAISVNKGILTDLDSSDATATAIRRSMFDTYNLVDAMRRNIEKAVRELVYACDTLLDAERGEAERAVREIRFSWSYSLLEDSGETFGQLIEGFDRGIVTKEEVRRFLF